MSPGKDSHVRAIAIDLYVTIYNGRVTKQRRSARYIEIGVLALERVLPSTKHATRPARLVHSDKNSVYCAVGFRMTSPRHAFEISVITATAHIIHLPIDRSTVLRQSLLSSPLLSSKAKTTVASAQAKRHTATYGMQKQNKKMSRRALASPVPERLPTGTLLAAPGGPGGRLDQYSVVHRSTWLSHPIPSHPIPSRFTETRREA